MLFPLDGTHFEFLGEGKYLLSDINFVRDLIEFICGESLKELIWTDLKTLNLKSLFKFVLTLNKCYVIFGSSLGKSRKAPVATQNREKTLTLNRRQRRRNFPGERAPIRFLFLRQTS